jgi:predicted TIM-barrel enzyme
VFAKEIRKTNITFVFLCFQFIRAEGFVFSHVADEGLMNACAGQLLRYRKQLGIEEKVAIFTDIKVLQKFVTFGILKGFFLSAYDL